jgi:NAD(P)-dependent dehydrogenase (short-subunit alcohol dehydrogenase family)
MVMARASSQIRDDGGAALATERRTGMGVLDGKVVVVTGAGQGIGREEALACARAGARVVVDDLAGAAETAAAVVAEGGQALALDLDVGDFDAAGRLVGAAVEAFGGLDGVVNNAGVVRDRMVEAGGPAGGDRQHDLHLRHPREPGPVELRRRQGRRGRLHRHHGAGAGEVRGARQRDRAGGADADDRGRLR